MKNLLNPDKADLDNDGKLSSYEKKRGMAIEESMKKRKNYVQGDMIMSEKNNDAAFKNYGLVLRGVQQVPVEDLPMVRELVVKGENLPERFNFEGEEGISISPVMAQQQFPEDLLKAIDFIMREAQPKEPMMDGGEAQIMEDEPRAMLNEGSLLEEDYDEQDMVPDDEMEEDYMEYVVNEALSEEEQDMFQKELEANPEIANLFMKVMDVAQEFSGAGEVEGPGTGVSDSIPARLSDGEFVFTAKAVEYIGADELSKMMKEAESAYDREQKQYGGLMLEEQQPEKIVRSETVVTKAQPVMGALLVAEDDIVEEQRRENLKANGKHVLS